MTQMSHPTHGLPFAVVDVETTGFSNRDRVLEIGVVHLDGDGTVTDRWSTLVNPDRDIGNSHIHGITGADVMAAPLFADIAGDLADLLAGRVFVAHNAPFDSRLLTAEFARLGVAGRPFAAASLCTMALTGRVAPASGRSLAAALSAAGITNSHAHAALGDAEATADLLHHYLLRFPGEVHGALTDVGPVTLPAAHLHALSGGHPVHLRPRTGPAPVADGSWISQFASGVPVVGQPNVDAYLDILAAAMLDRELSAHEIHQLTACATDLGIGQEEARTLHLGFVRQLAVLAWADGVVTPDERDELTAVARLLAVPAAEVNRLLDAPVAASTPGNGPLTALAPGDRVTFTGTTDLPREVWTARATEAGLDVGGVTKRSVLVVAADPDSLSGKAKKARALGIPVVTEAGFARLLGELENTGSGAVDPELVVAASRPVEGAEPEEPGEQLSGVFYDAAEPDLTPVLDLDDTAESGHRVRLAPEVLTDALDTAFGLLGVLARTHGSLRTAVEDARAVGVDGELPAYVEDLLARAGDHGGAFRTAGALLRGSVSDVLARVWDSCDDRERAILRDRFVAQPPATLDQIAAQVGLTRERIRQIQQKLLARIRPVATSGPVADLLTGVRAHACPVTTLEAVTAVFPELADIQPGWEAPVWQILDAFDDDFRVDDGWLCFPDLPTAARRTAELVAPLVNEEGVVALATVLERSSIDDPTVLRDWLTTCGYLQVGEHVFTRVGSQPARAAALLSVVGHPMSAADLYAGISDAKTERSFRNGLNRGGDLVRVGVDRWALTRWGLPEYTGIADLIGRQVDAAVAAGDDGVPLDDLVDGLSRDFGVSTSSVKTYAATGEFTSTGGTVRRRTEPMVNNADPEDSNGLYLRDGRWCHLVTVTADHLRGSGSTVPNGMTAALDLPWNEPLLLPSDLGEQRVTWGNIGNSTIGSIRRYLEDLGCGLGDRVWIDLHDGQRFTVDPAPASTPGLTGIAWLADHVGAPVTSDEETDIAAVAGLLGLRPDAPRRKILARFRHRSDAPAVEVLEELWM